MCQRRAVSFSHVYGEKLLSKETGFADAKYQFMNIIYDNGLNGEPFRFCMWVILVNRLYSSFSI